MCKHSDTNTVCDCHRSHSNRWPLQRKPDAQSDVEHVPQAVRDAWAVSDARKRPVDRAHVDADYAQYRADIHAKARRHHPDALRADLAAEQQHTDRYVTAALGVPDEATVTGPKHVSSDYWRDRLAELYAVRECQCGDVDSHRSRDGFPNSRPGKHRY
jgi:hypothetical protein